MVIEADPAAPAWCCSTPLEREFGPVAILVNNATGWVQDTFTPASADQHGRALQPVTAATWQQQFAVDAMAAALLIGEFARRHVARGAGWGRIIGLTSGGELGFPSEVSYGAAKAAQANYTMSAALELGQYGITANMIYPPVTDTGLGHRRGARVRGLQPHPLPRGQPGAGRRGHRLPGLGCRRADHRQHDLPALTAAETARPAGLRSRT